MIIFKNVKYRNILSIGNNFIEIPLNSNPTTLIVGKNGCGKCLRDSTLVDIDFDNLEVKKAFEDFIKEGNFE